MKSFRPTFIMVCLVIYFLYFCNSIAQAKTYYSLEEALKKPETADELILNTREHPFIDYRENIRSILPQLGKLVNLRKLDLNSSLPTQDGKGQLPSAIFKLTNLVELDLSNNGLEELPSDIQKLTNLQKLNLSQNSLSKFSSEICGITNLVELDFSNIDL